MNAARDALSALRRSLAQLAPSGAAHCGLFGLGAPLVDEALGGGLSRGGIHEVFAGEVGDGAAAAGFAVALALRNAGPAGRILWVRHEMAGLETGSLYAPGLGQLGADPDAFILVAIRDVEAALRAADEAMRCAALSAVIIEVWGEKRVLDLTASRRLSLAAEKSGVTGLFIRAAADPSPSAALTRWSVKAAASTPLAAGAPGSPAFDLELLRHRAGLSGGPWRVEWNRDQRSFRDVPALPGALAPLPDHRPPEAGSPPLRRAG
jgi:protein ImuA